MSNEEIIRLLKREMTAIAPEAKAFLYGSRARGDNTPFSDVDILILLPDSYEGHEFAKRVDEVSSKLYNISLEHNIDISPLITVEKIFNQRETPFTLNVKKEGIPL